MAFFFGKRSTRPSQITGGDGVRMGEMCSETFPVETCFRTGKKNGQRSGKRMGGINLYRNGFWLGS